MKTKLTMLNTGSGELFWGHIPIVCPHCSTTIEPLYIGHGGWRAEKVLYYCVGFKGNCCSQPFNVTYKANQVNPKSKDNPAEIISIHPIEKPKEFSELIKANFPRFIELYNHSSESERKGHFSLAGTGYRNALEILVKDFAEKFLGKEDSEISSKNLSDSIKEYIPGVDSTIAAHGIRLIGNNFTHWKQDVTFLDLESLHSFYGIVISAINTQLLIRNLTEKGLVKESHIGNKS